MHISGTKREQRSLPACRRGSSCGSDSGTGAIGALAGATRSDNSNGRKRFGHSSYDQLRLRQMLNRGQNQKWNREENWEWILMDVSALQNVQVESSSSYLFLGSELDRVVAPLLTAPHQILDHLPQTLLLSLRDPKEGQPECLAAYPLHVCRFNHEWPFDVWRIDA